MHPNERNIYFKEELKHVLTFTWLDLNTIFCRKYPFKIYILDVHGKSSGRQRRNICKLDI